MRLFFLTATRVGDAVLSTGLLAALLERHPGARVTVAAGRPAAPLFRAVPGLEELIVVDKQRRGRHWLALWRRIAGRPWGLAVDLRASALTRLIVARRRLIVPLRAREEEHRVEELGRIARIAPPPPRLWLTAADHAAAAALLPAGEDLLALAPTANWSGKQWPAERFAALAERLRGAGAPLAGLRVAVLGAESERAMAAPLMEALGPAAVDLMGRTELPVAGALLARARLFVGNDSGLMHLAAAAGAPTLGLFGPTPDRRYAPWGPRAATVRTPESLAGLGVRPDFGLEPQPSLMTGLAVERVEEAALALLRRTAGNGDSLSG